jgi:hypothetical protein
MCYEACVDDSDWRQNAERQEYEEENFTRLQKKTQVRSSLILGTIEYHLFVETEAKAQPG